MPTVQNEPQREDTVTAEHVDVLILGAGLSGVGAACHLRRECPEKSFLLLEAREQIGGTWDLFRYPGIRSDSDMFTLGYRFMPWEEPQSIADGASIRNYIARAAHEHDVERQVRFGHRAISAEWSTPDARWTVRAERADTGETVAITCSFIFGCTGYYRYDEGYTPTFPGIESFQGEVIHPQHWPEGLDYSGKRVVVIGSGATAVTLVPSMAEQAAHVTMLQRTPSYILTVPGEDPIAKRLRRRLTPERAYALIRWKNVLMTLLMYSLCRRWPNMMAGLLKRLAARQLPPGFDIRTHLSPTYDPWDQRLCLVPDGDLFGALSSGRASIVTGQIDHFTPSGIELGSGEELEADIVVTATGLNLQILGGLQLTVDGQPVELGETVVYRGMMLCGVPNFALTVGYTNASWTLKADLVAEYVCRTLRHMDATGKRICTPTPPGMEMEKIPIIDLQSGYVLRSIAELPKQGAEAPWRLHQNYVRDLRLLRHGALDDHVAYSNPQPTQTSSADREAVAV